MDNKEKTEAKVSFKNGINVHDSDKDVSVSFKNGIHVHSDSENVDVSFKDGVHVETDKDSVHLEAGELKKIAKEQTKKHRGSIISSTVMYLVAVIAYVLIGTYGGAHGWSRGWLVLLAVPVIDSLIRAIKNKKPSDFAYPVLATIVFMLLGFFMSCWHPAWVIFLTIPIYYIICDKIQKKDE